MEPTPVSDISAQQPSASTLNPSADIPKPALETAIGSVKRSKKPGSGWMVWILLIVLLISAIFGLWWWFTKRTAPIQKITLRYWGLNEPATVMGPIFEQYTAANPNIEIKYINSSPQEYRQRLMAQLTAEDFNGPDLFRFHNTWVPMLGDQLAALPVSVYSQSEFNKIFYPVVQRDLKQGASYAGIPLQIDGLGLFYNEDMFIAAGLTPPINVEWPKLREMATKLRTIDPNNNLLTGGIALGLSKNVDHWQDIVAVMMLQGKANLSKPSGQTTLNALNFFGTFNKTDKVWDETMPESTLAFATGKVAMYLGPAYEIANITQLSRDNGTVVRFKVAPIPQLPEVNATWSSYWVEGVSSRSSKSHQAAAWDLLKYLSQKDTLEQLYRLQERNRGFGMPYSRVDLAEQLKDHPQLGAYVLQAPAARSWYLASDTTDQDGINDRINKEYLVLVNEATIKSVTEGSLKKAVPKIQEILKEYGVE